MLIGDAKNALGISEPVVAAPDPENPDAPRPEEKTSPVKLPGGGKWARYAGKLGGAVTVAGCSAIIKHQGYKPEDPDDDSVDLFVDALEEGLLLEYGEKNIPWWLGAAMAASGIYAGMRIGAEKMEPKPKNLTEPSKVPTDEIKPDTKNAEPKNQSSIFPEAIEKK